MEKNVKNPGIIRKSILQILSLTVILALIMPIITNAQSGKANFSGTWAFNALKTNPGQGARAGAGSGGGNFVATQEANFLTVVTTRTSSSGTTTTTTIKYTLDGKESLNIAAGGGSAGGESKSIAKWSPDGKSLTIVTTRTVNDNTIRSTEVWSLIDANTLSRITTSPGPNGDRITKMVYDKK
jgi:hypothetical protein